MLKVIFVIKRPSCAPIVKLAVKALETLPFVTPVYLVYRDEHAHALTVLRDCEFVGEFKLPEKANEVLELIHSE